MFKLNLLISLLCALFLFKEIYSQNDQFSPPYVFLQQPLDGGLELEGNSKILPCSANGIPQPRYSWLKDGTHYKNDSSEAMLKLQNIKVQNAGIYQCIATNYLGSIISNKATISVVYMGNFQSSLSQSLSCAEGDSILLTPPKIDSVPSASFQWQDSNVLYTGELLRYHVTLRNELVILETKQSLDSEKVYKVKATNTYIQSNIESLPFSVIITGPVEENIKPKFVIFPKNETVIQGNDNMVKLECVANAKPITSLVITWYRILNTTQILKINMDQFKYTISTYGRVLTINNPMVEDSGAYICRATYQFSSLSSNTINATAYLNVYVKPSFIISPPSRMSATVGSIIMLPCYVNAIPNPNITWYKNAQLIKSNRYEVQKNGSLLISQLDQTDASVLQCFISNPAGEISATTWLKIENLIPTIINFPQNKTAIVGDQVNFTCSAKGAPIPVIRWFKESANNVLIEILSSFSNIIGSDSLTLKNVSKIDDGTYLCKAINEAGEDSADAFLFILSRTKIVVNFPYLSTIKGSTILLPCSITKDDKVIASWNWYYGFTNFTNNPRYRILADGSLEITAVRNLDMGVYVCSVISVAGNDTASTNLTIKELPYPPKILNISLLNESTSIVRITFKPDFDGFSPIKFFVVRYLDVTTTNVPVSCSQLWSLATDVLPASATFVDVYKLLPSRSYSFCMSTISEVGEGESVQYPYSISLPQIAPSSSPIGLWGSARSSSSIILQWKAPEQSTWNGPLLGYILQYKLSGYPDVTLTKVNITPFQETVTYELKNLIVWQEYNISVAAFNMIGPGVFSASYFIKTEEGLPTYPPSDISFKVLSSTGVEISWGPPATQSLNGVLMGYRIFLAEGVDRSADEIVFKNFTISVDVSAVNLIQKKQILFLQKYTTYSFQISCYNFKGAGPLSPSLIFVTYEDVPDKVENLKILEISDKKLQIIWDPPKYSNGIIIGYKLIIKNLNMNISNDIENLNNRTFNYTFFDLASTTSYLVEVGAFTKIGVGVITRLECLTTETPVLPSPPTDLLPINITSDTLVLVFTLNFNGHAPIINWFAEYQEIDKTNWIKGTLIAKQDSVNRITVKNFKPNKKYRIRLKAENIVGSSEPSVATEWFQTLPSVPLITPTIIFLMPISQSSLKLRWNLINTEDWGGEESQAYIIEWKESVASTYTGMQRISDSGNLSFIIGGLQAYTKYDVHMAAANRVGIGKFSSLSTVKTLESVPSKSPSNFLAFAVNSTCIKANWSKLDMQYWNGIPLGYMVSYSNFENGIKQLLVNDSFVYLNNLMKYTLYNISIFAYTIEGHGPFQIVTVRTAEDVPNSPSSSYFSNISPISASLNWLPPLQPNGIIIGYSVFYGIQTNPQVFSFIQDGLSSMETRINVDGLSPDKYYVFALKAKTQIGWGEEVRLLLCTSDKQEPPTMNVIPIIIDASITSRSMMITWNKTNMNTNEYLMLRNISILQSTNGENYQSRNLFAYPSDNQITIPGLKPDTLYSFRIILSNDWGHGEESSPTDIRKTKMEIPYLSPNNLQLEILSANSIKATWMAPPLDSINGPLKGYQLVYKSLLDVDQWFTISITDPQKRFYTINNLQLFVMYEVKVAAVNVIGVGPFTSSIRIQVELAPSESVTGMQVDNITSSSFKLFWDVPNREANFDAFKIYINTTQQLTVQPSANSTVIMGLKPFQKYEVNMLLFNSVGEGPLLQNSIIVQTQQDVPSKIDKIKLIVTSLTSVNVSWAPPTLPNGIIKSYDLVYYQNLEARGVTSNIVLHLPNSTTNYHITRLVENVNYIFGIKAATIIGFGEIVYKNITVAPQLDGPGKPSKPLYQIKNKFIYLSWLPNSSNIKPIISTIIQHSTIKENQWTTIDELIGNATSTQLDVLTFDNKEEHLFRVINVNEDSVGLPSDQSDTVKTLDLLAELDRPFYQQWWFLIIIALIILIVIIIVIALLCAKGRKKKKDNDGVQRLRSFSIQNNNHSRMYDDQDASFLYQRNIPSQSLHGSIHSIHQRNSSKNNSLTGHSEVYSNPSSSVNNLGYVNNGDETGFDEISNTSSTCIKPSDYSISPSSQAMYNEAYLPESLNLEPRTRESIAPISFHNHYVNENVSDSWQRNNKIASMIYGDNVASNDKNYFGATFSSSQLAINNVAGSRAPLPGLSSFV